MKKIGRNDPCHCGSGKKFKKCCESKMIGGRYVATKIDAARSVGLSGLFNRQISAITKPTDAHRPIRITGAVAAAPLTPAPTPVATEKVE